MIGDICSGGEDGGIRREGSCRRGTSIYEYDYSEVETVGGICDETRYGAHNVIYHRGFVH
jgi:hypothetical protein